MTEFCPISHQGYHHILLAVDCFAKWTELVPQRMKDSFEITQWLLQELILRFGVPCFIRVDAGLEFEGNL